MKRFILLLGLIVPTLIFGQGESNNWYFGDNAGISFDPMGTVTALTDGQVNTIEGCASLSDAAGNILFYTDGVTVYNRTHSVMVNGTGLFGQVSSTQSAIIVPWPQNPDLFYIFTVNHRDPSFTYPNQGLHYSVVDITRNGGNGEVIQKNTRLLDACAEKIVSVIKDCAAESLWIVVFGNDDSPLIQPSRRNNFDTYRSFEITAAGITTPSVQSPSAALSVDRYGAEGYMKISPDGTQLVSAHMDSGLFLYDFDVVTGSITNERQLFMGGSNLFAYGVEFSANGRYLYVHSSSARPIFRYSSLFQMDLWAGDNIAISNSRVNLDPIHETFDITRGALQRGPDGKIYRALQQGFNYLGEALGLPYLGVINNPDIGGVGANYIHNGVFLDGRNSFQGLPPLVPSFFTTVELIPNDIGIVVPSFEVCEGAPLKLEATFVPGASYEWQDDVGNILTDSDTDEHILNIPVMDLASAGNYSVTVIRSSSPTCPITESIEIIVNPAPTTTATTLNGCDQDSNPSDGLTSIDLTQLEDASFDYYYYISPAERTADNPIAVPTAFTNTVNPQTIYYKAVNPTTGCENDNGEIELEILFGPTVTLDDTFYLCSSGPLTITGPAGLDGYRWIRIESTGDVDVSLTQDAIIDQVGNYRLEGTTDHGTVSCTTDEFFEVISPSITAVDIIPNATVASTSFAVCEGEALTLETQVFAGASYVWARDGVDLGAPDSRTFEIPATATTDSGDYTVTITGPGELICPVEGNIAITVNTLPLTTTETVVTCDSDSSPTDGLTNIDLTQIETDPTLTYEYYETILDRDNNSVMVDPSNFTNSIAFDQTVYFKTTNSSGCENFGDLEVQVRIGPDITLDDTFYLCSSGPITITGPAGLDSYRWIRIESTGDVEVSLTQDAIVDQVGNYRLEGSTDYGTVSCTTDAFFEVVSPTITAVDIIPNATSAASSFTVCEGEVLTLETQDFAGATYVWARDGVALGAPDSSTFEIPATATTDSGDYTVTITGPGELICPVEGVINITVNAFSGTSNAIVFTCDSDGNATDGFTTIDLTQIETDPTLTYAYYATILDRDNDITMGDPTNFTNSIAFDETVYFKTTNSSGCENFGDLEVQVRTGPDISLDPTYWLCAGDSDITIAGPVALDGYQWFRIEGSNEVLVSSSQDASMTQAGNYRLEGSTEYTVGTQIYTCSTSVLFEIMTPSVTSADIVPNGDTSNNGTFKVCEGQLLSMETQVFTGASYVWEKDGLPLGASNSNILQINPTSIADAGDYTVTISGPGELSCPITGNLTLVVDNTLETASLSLLSCDLDVDNPYDGITTLDLTQFESDPSFNYTYYTSIADRDSDNAMLNPESFTNTQAFDQTVYFRITNSFGCEGLGEILLKVRTAPELTLEESYTFCPSNPDLTIAAPDGYDTYQWFLTDGAAEQLVSENQNFEPIEAGDYRLEASVEHADGTKTISCATNTTFIITPSNTAVIEEIQVTGYGDDNQVTVMVSGNGDYEYSIDGSNYQDENVFNNLPVGTITFYVQDKNGCGVTEETKDIAEDLSAYGFPKFFTPNGDGINDYWQFKPSPGSFEIDLSTIRIFNRYGNMLAQIGPNSSGWDGRFNGKPVPSTDYWFCAFTINNQEIRGHFSLKR